MATSITRTWGAEVVPFYPVQLTGYQTSRDTQNIVHEILGGGIAVSQRGAQSRSGNLELLFDTETAAQTAVTELAKLGTFALTDSDRASIAMTFVVSGTVTLALDDETRELWTVSVAYREVS